MRYNTLTQAQYEILRNAIAEVTENFVALPYDDNGNAPGGFPTVGIGIRTDIAANVDAILSVLGVDTSTPAGSALHGNISALSGNTNQLIIGWNNAFDIYNGVPLVPPSGNSYPLSIAQARDIKSLVYQSREDDLTDSVEITNLLGGGTVENYGTNDVMDIGNDTNEVPYSVERATLADMQFNGAPLSNSPSLRNGAVLENAGALTNGTNANIVISDAYARSIAYYEIAYNSNANNDNGLAKRRIVEAANLGLYDEDYTVNDAVTTAQFFNNLSGYRGNAFDMVQTIDTETTARGGVFHQVANGDIIAINAILATYNVQNPGAEIPTIDLIWAEAQTINMTYNLGQTISATGQDWNGTKLALYTKWKAVLAAQEQLQEFGYSNIDADPGNNYAVLDANLNIALTHYQDNDDHVGNLINSNYLFGGRGVNILTGGNNADVLFGLGGDDTLNGNDGDDILSGGAGADTLDGGAGIDAASYADAQGGVIASLLVGGTFGDALGDTYSNIENLIGSDHNDVLTGDILNNRISAGGGDDLVFGTFGLLDVYDGGSHENGDYVNYISMPIPVSISVSITALDFATVSKFSIAPFVGPILVGVDTLTNFEGIAGTVLNDTFTVSGLGQNWDLDGGDGTDTLAFVNAPPGSLLFDNGDGSGMVISGGFTVFYENFETVTGDFAAAPGGTIINGPGAQFDAGGDSIITGTPGSDIINGLDGNDTIFGTAGDDQLTGGLGTDTLNGDAGDDTLYGGDDADIMDGGDGDDTLFGEGGDDTLRGSLGGDVYDGGAGVDLVTYQSTGAAITLDLTDLSANTGAAAGDSYAEVEEWGGSNLDDLMTADGANDNICVAMFAA